MRIYMKKQGTGAQLPPFGSPNITGTPTENQVLTANTSGYTDPNGITSIVYQWNRNGSPIGGATNLTYTLTASDVGTTITVTATITDGYGKVEDPVTSAGVGPVASALGYTSSPYTTAVMADNPSYFFPLQDTNGTKLMNAVTNTTVGTLSNTGDIIYNRTGPTVGGTVLRSMNFKNHGSFALPSVLPGVYTTGISMDCWVKYTDPNGNNHRMAWYDSNNVWGLWKNSPQFLHQYPDGDGVYIGNNTWAHVAIVFHPNPTYKSYLYVNGVLNSASTQTITSGWTTGTIRFGEPTANITDTIAFDLSNVAFYNYPLTLTQINNHINAS